MIKLENIHTDAELLSVFKRLADRLAGEIEKGELAVAAECAGMLSHSEIERIEEKVLEEFVAQENVLELPLPEHCPEYTNCPNCLAQYGSPMHQELCLSSLAPCTLCGEVICSCASNDNQALLRERFGVIGSLNLI